MFLILMKCLLSICSFVDCAVRAVAKKSLPNASHKDFMPFSPLPPDLQFSVLCLGLRSHLGVNCGSTFIFLLMDVQL